jgi:hypothetical protein
MEVALALRTGNSARLTMNKNNKSLCQVTIGYTKSPVSDSCECKHKNKNGKQNGISVSRN